MEAARDRRRRGRHRPGDRYLVLDAEGRQLTDAVPGRPSRIGGGYAVLWQSAGPTTGLPAASVRFSVHRVRG